MKETLEKLNKAQYQAVTTTSNFVRVIAGAGSGKTHVLTSRIAYLLEKQMAQPYEILAITFTNKAAAEMKERVARTLGVDEDNSDVWVMTFHAFCARILRYHIHLLGYNNNYNILDTADQRAILKELYKKDGIKSTEFPYAAVLSKISAYKMSGLTLAQIEKRCFTAGDRTIAYIYNLYQNYLTRQKVLDFDDLLLKCVELFKKEPAVLERYSQRFKYILVDEFQDTNDVQFDLVKMLATSKTEQQNLYIVGDPDQSIYGWRGAQDRLILDFDKTFPNVETITLEENYRSTQTILDAANILIQNNQGRLAKNLFTRSGKGDAINIYEASDEKNEADHIAIKIKSLVRERGEKYFGEIAILYRANFLSRAIEEGFIRHGVPYTIYGDTRFLDRREIKDMLAYLQLTLNPDDDIAFRRIVNVPKRNVGDKTLDKLTSYADDKEISLFQSLEMMIGQASKGKARQQLDEFASLILEMNENMNDFAVDEILDMIYDRSGYEAMLHADETALGRVENVAELKQALIDFAAKHEDKPAREILGLYLQEMALLSSVDKEQTPFSVSLMTVHAAKGLEFDTVFIIGINEGIFPSRRSIEEGNEEEERRLAYVAITRAKSQLYISYPRGFNVMTKETKMPSSFLFEANLLSERANPLYEKTPQFVHKEPKKSIIDMSFRQEAGDVSFKSGDKVRHKKFGDGRVVTVSGAQITVAFSAEFGIKTLVANFIEKI